MCIQQKDFFFFFHISSILVSKPKKKMVMKKSSVSGNGCEREFYVAASQRRPSRPMKNQLHSLNLPLLPATENIVRPEKESSEMAHVTQDNRPCFFKIILGSVKERLRIPPKFLHHVSKDLTKTATLKIFSGGLWTVQINKTDDGVFMEDGWQQFLRDNSLKDRHFLVFTYDGDMSFIVKIFELNGCERDYAAAASHCTTTMPPQEAAISPNTGKGQRGRPRKKPVHTPNLHLHPATENLGQVNSLHVTTCKKIDMVKKVKNQSSSKLEKKKK
ncbi:hypothetical protein JRO89_XS02G0058500 [Xanthoceras sorbifolium]|uniref:TF-B3 domain-containing protein n=1 Tax=Xanthoceras sorbifolium TaxID=99658 RepID=A0ABQ8IEU1_9ROSI|nr:hypothetical protein JRO89_XS02G0058500 [Xanthoceras sorbifolium]